MTVTSKLQANAERNEEIEKRQKREEKAASSGGAVRGSVPTTDQLHDDVSPGECVLLKRKKQKARPKGVNLKVRWRARVAMR